MCDLFPYTRRKQFGLARLQTLSLFAFVFAILFSICVIALHNLISLHWKKRAQNKSRISFCVAFNLFLCWSCCKEEGREEVSRDVTDSGSDSFSRSSNGCSIASIKLYSRKWLFVIKNFTTGILILGGGGGGYSLTISTLFEEYPRCHNWLGRCFHYFYLPLIRQNVSHAQKYCRLIANNQKQFMIVFPYRCFLAFALLLIANKT